MRIVQVPKFLTPYGMLEFVPVGDVPGHTHRVVVEGEAQPLWVPRGSRADAKMAKFFIRVVHALKEGREKYYYVDRDLDPPVPDKVST